MIIKNKKDLVKKLIVGTFTAIPFFSSLISTVHLVDIFMLGNAHWMSIMLAITFEIGSIASLLTLTILDKINKSMVMTIFVILMIMQLIGNIYFSFDFINQHLQMDPNWLGSFQELVSYFVAGDLILMKLIVSCLVGIPIPLISLLFLKSVVDYLKSEEVPIEQPVVHIEKAPTKTEPIVEEIKETIKPTESLELPKVDLIEENIPTNEPVVIINEVPQEVVYVYKESEPVSVPVNEDIKAELSEKKEEEPINEDDDEIKVVPTVVEVEEKTSDYKESFKEIEEALTKRVPSQVGPSNVAVYQNNNLL